MAKHLVTGGAGFIGSHLTEELVNQGHPVVVLDDLSTGKLENIASFRENIQFVEGSVANLDTVRSCCEGVDVVFHQAALASVPRSVADPLASNHANVTGTLTVLWAARDAGVRRVVYAASSSVYGDTEELPKHEGMIPRPQSPYAVNKHVGELYCQVFDKLYGLSTIGLRYFNVFGPRQDPNSQYAAAIPLFASGRRKQGVDLVLGKNIRHTATPSEGTRATGPARRLRSTGPETTIYPITTPEPRGLVQTSPAIQILPVLPMISTATRVLTPGVSARMKRTRQLRLLKTPRSTARWEPLRQTLTPVRVQ